MTIFISSKNSVDKRLASMASLIVTELAATSSVIFCKLFGLVIWSGKPMGIYKNKSRLIAMTAMPQIRP